MPAAPPVTDSLGTTAPGRRRRPLMLTLCSALVAALLGVAALAPLPYSVAQPGMTADVLGEHEGEPVISISGTEVRDTDGELRMTTIAATSPDARVGIAELIAGYAASDRAVMPRDAVYPVGDTTEEIREHGTAQMRESQGAAVEAALVHLGMEDGDVAVELRLADVGGPSAGLLFSLGIIDLIEGDGNGGGLTGGLTVAGTGTISPDGTVGAVGGVPLKTQAAHRDGATVFLVPERECGDAKSGLPQGLRLIPVTTLAGAVADLRALGTGGRVSSC
ncbi:hypothetical protein GCM10009716_44030 [Streptomyces sodiiphilus]|uniref:Lon proteolytic domain-containing protein n=1 Tax=Streptomyces sodiiphilus TaxID=226217 RepID=A0ABP5B8S5_9ACTN